MVHARSATTTEENKTIGQNCANATAKGGDCASHRAERNANGVAHRPTRPNRIARHFKSSSVLSPPIHLAGPSVRTPSAVGDFSACSSPQAFPRLANALRSLLLSSSAKSSSKTAFVDAADELIYYSNAIPSATITFSDANGREKAQRQNGANNRTEKSGAKKQRSPSLQQRESSDCGNRGTTEEKGQNGLWHGQPTTLEQIKALYKSVPNFAFLDETERHAEETGRESFPLHFRDECPALLCPPSTAHPPPVQPQRKRLPIIQHKQRNYAYFSAGTSEFSGASLSSAKCMPFQRRKCHLPVEVPKPFANHLHVDNDSQQNSLGSCSLNSFTSLHGHFKFDGVNGKKKSSTDSGYRSRAETPPGKPMEPRGHAAEGSEGEGQSDRKDPFDRLSPTVHHPPPKLTPFPLATRPLHFSQCPRDAICKSQRHNPRLYLWTLPINADQLRSTAPISWGTIAFPQKADGRTEGQPNGASVGVLVELLVGMAFELRRLCAVLGKCTSRDIAVVTLLFLPTSLAWHAIRNAQQTAEYFERTAADQSKRWQSLSDRSLLKHLNGGLFLRWMIDSRIGAIVDEKVALFFAAIFDFLLSRLLLQFGLLPSESVSSSELFDSLATSLAHSRDFHLLAPPSSSDGYSFSELSLIVQNLPLGQFISTDDTLAEISQFGTSFDDKLCMDGEAILALYHFIGMKKAPPLEHWLKKGALYALQRRANTVRHWDIVQAAHLLLPDFDCPPPTASHLFADDHSCFVQFCAATKAILLGTECHSHKLTMVAVPMDAKMFPDFSGWTPLSWAIAMEETQLVGAAIGQPNGERAVRSENRHIQIAASTGNFALCELLLRAGANPFGCVTLASSPTPFGPSPICPSAFAIAALRGDQKMLALFLSFCSFLHQRWDNGKGANAFGRPPADFPPSTPFTNDSFSSLNEHEKWAFSEAIYLAAETQRWEVAVGLRGLGVRWPNVGCWMGALGWAMENDDQQKMEQLIDDFETTTLASELAKNGEEGKKERGEGIARNKNYDGMAQMGHLFFRLLSSASFSSVRFCAARALSSLFARLQRPPLAHHFEREFGVFFCPSKPPFPIDSKFVDSPELSDIRFRFSDGQIVFGHRIVLVNASEQFRRILNKPHGILEMSECDAHTFRLLLEFIYGNTDKCMSEMHKMDIDKRMDTVKAAKHFGLRRLDESAQKATGRAISVEHFAKVYAFAREMKCETLRKNCEHFALVHLVQLMSAGKWWTNEANLNTEERDSLMEGMKRQFENATGETDV